MESYARFREISVLVGRLFKVAALVCGAAAVTGTVLAADTQVSHGLYASEIISANELQRLMRTQPELVVFDARTPRSFEDGHIKGARLPRSADYYRSLQLFEKGIIRKAPDMDLGLKEGVKGLARGTPIVVYCNAHCSASSVLLFKLKGLGFSDVRSMEEGYQVWEAKGYPVVKK